MKVPAQQLIPLLQETALNRGTRARLTVTGSSMVPSLHEGDQVELAALGDHRITPGDLLLVQRDAATYVLHRVVRVADAAFWMLGDAQVHCEGPFTPAQVVGLVVAAWHDSRALPLPSPGWRLWLWLRPWRAPLIRLGVKLRRCLACCRIPRTQGGRMRP